MKRIFPSFILILSLSSFLVSSFLPSLLPEVSGWKLSEPPKLFTPENLYEHINGGAEAYLTFGFKELMVAYFERNVSSLTIEIYDMGNCYNSFGIYSVERSPENLFLEIGNHGYTDDENLFFIVGPLYVKIYCSDCGKEATETIKTFAMGIVEKVKDKGKLPEVLRYFPEKGRVKNSEKFFPKNFLGIDFLKNGFQAEYKEDGEIFYLFIIEENEKRPEETFEKFKSYLERKKGFEKFQFDSNEGFVAEDRVHGKIAISRKGRFIVGYIGHNEPEKIEGYLRNIIEKIGG